MASLLKTPVFILFAEMMGYKSELVPQAEQWCNGDLPSEHVQRAMLIDARNLSKVMHEDYDDDEIDEWQEVYWDIALSEYDKSLEGYLNKDV